MRWVMRIFGGLNIGAGLFGLYYFAWLIEIHWHKWPGNPSISDWAVFVALSCFTTFLVVYLGYLGIRLIRVDFSALWQVCLVLVLEMVFLIADVWITWLILPSSMSKIAVGFWGIADGPITPQIVTGYPLIGLIAAVTLMLLQRRSRRAVQTAVA